MNPSVKKYLPIIIILAVSLTTHFLFFGHPNETVFDEVHFGKFISGYFTHEYFFDIHPPLGKLLISGMGYLTGFQPGFSFANIGDKFPDNAYLWLRLLPTLAGALLPIVIYLLALRLGFSRLTAFTAGMLLALENAFLVQSRFILLDAFLLLFGFSALLFYFNYRNRNSLRWLILVGIAAGLSASVKWTGVSFLAIILVIFAWNQLRNFSDHWRHEVLKGVIFLILVPLTIYILMFVVHLKLLTKSGPGDAFMTPEFRKTLEESTEYGQTKVQPLNMAQKIIELNGEMYRSNATLTAEHSYASKWYTWPFMQRPIYYWHGSAPSTNPAQVPQDSRIYFLGNPAIWFLSTLAIFYLILDQLSKLFTKKRIEFVPGLIVGAYIVNLLPFIGINRPMFLYHYMIGYIFAILALAYLIDSLNPSTSSPRPELGTKAGRIKKAILTALIGASAILFIYFSPLSYGLPLTPSSYNNTVWFPTWR